MARLFLVIQTEDLPDSIRTPTTIQNPPLPNHGPTIRENQISVRREKALCFSGCDCRRQADMFQREGMRLGFGNGVGMSFEFGLCLS
jgi:hypothetical protein